MRAQEREFFLSSLLNKKKVRLSFRRADGVSVTRLAAPLDLGPVRRKPGQPVRYQFWDYGGRSAHWLKLSEDQILIIGPTNESFDPAEFVTWDLAEAPWSIPRDWGKYS
jgi:hypothetical protein